ncbi:hypothetical protein TWF481_001184 [Arthrobotrys musiformis]|uniref:Spaetzle domain-containing protein n=1 Tax=Arthrobotrys musiformis TaxID=47236 RepID=A0AAV9WPT5_9PEZI
MRLENLLGAVVGAANPKCNNDNNNNSILSIIPTLIVFQLLVGINPTLASPIASGTTTVEKRDGANQLQGDENTLLERSNSSANSLIGLANAVFNTTSPVVVVVNSTDSTGSTTIARPKIKKAGGEGGEKDDTPEPDTAGSTADDVHDTRNKDHSKSSIGSRSGRGPGQNSFFEAPMFRVVCPRSPAQLLARMRDYVNGRLAIDFRQYGGDDQINYLLPEIVRTQIEISPNEQFLQNRAQMIQDNMCYRCFCNQDGVLVRPPGAGGTGCGTAIAVAQCRGIYGKNSRKSLSFFVTDVCAFAHLYPSTCSKDLLGTRPLYPHDMKEYLHRSLDFHKTLCCYCEAGAEAPQEHVQPIPQANIADPIAENLRWANPIRDTGPPVRGPRGVVYPQMPHPQMPHPQMPRPPPIASPGIPNYPRYEYLGPTYNPDDVVNVAGPGEPPNYLSGPELGDFYWRLRFGGGGPGPGGSGSGGVGGFKKRDLLRSNQERSIEEAKVEDIAD